MSSCYINQHTHLTLTCWTVIISLSWRIEGIQLILLNQDELTEYVTDTIRDLVKEDQQTLIVSLLTDINNIIISSGAYL